MTSQLNLIKKPFKTCPKCKVPKPLEDYHSYFSKARQTTRIANYCKPCSKVVSLINAKRNYLENIEKKLRYAKAYRVENAEAIKIKRPEFKKKRIKELQNCYVRELLVSKSKIAKEAISENMIRTKRTMLKIKRTIKKLKNDNKK